MHARTYTESVLREAKLGEELKQERDRGAQVRQGECYVNLQWLLLDLKHKSMVVHV